MAGGGWRRSGATSRNVLPARITASCSLKWPLRWRPGQTSHHRRGRAGTHLPGV